ncbi:MAG TPA: D-arabinono-1,4-lactone oxidase, partial [Thermoleophilaceae bacterium]|nr:D-arabinono-1,4-lactone oxidase [Thermoleophilaceae bacterium]
VSLGSLGAISTVTLRCVPAFTIHRLDAPRALDLVLDELDALVDGADHFEAFVMPHTRRCLTLTSERTAEKPRRRSPLRRLAQDTLIENAALGAACRIGRRAPALIPAINRRIAGLLGPAEHLDASHRVYANRRWVHFTEMEYGIAREHAAAALERVLATIERRRLPVGFPIELRVVGPDEALLSTAHERPTAYIAVHQYRGMEFESYFRAVERIMDDYDGRPHWGKRHYQSAASLRGRYPAWDRFAAVRARLDPSGRFANDYTERVLGPVLSGMPAAAAGRA